MPYIFRDDLSIADVAFDVEEESLEKLFESAAMAVENSMVENPDAIEAKETREIRIEAENEEKLLHDFLDELIFYKDAEMLVFGKFEVKIEKNDKVRLKATAGGEKIEPERHHMLVDVKSVTWHHFSLKKNGRWKATVILDV